MDERRIGRAAIERASRGERVPELIALKAPAGWKAPLIAGVSWLALLGVAAWAFVGRDLDHPWVYHDDLTMIALPLVPLMIAGLLATFALARRWRSPVKPALLFAPGAVLRVHADGRVDIAPMKDARPPVVSGNEVRFLVAGEEIRGRAIDTTTARRAASLFEAHRLDPVPDIEQAPRPGGRAVRVGIAVLGAPLLVLFVVYGAWTANFVLQVNDRWGSGPSCDFKYFARDSQTQALDLVLELAELRDRLRQSVAVCPDQ